MAWNPSPEVAVARDAAQRLGELATTGVTRVVIMYEVDDGRTGYVSYGRTRQLCKEAHDWAERLFADSEGLPTPLKHAACQRCGDLDLSGRDGDD